MGEWSDYFEDFPEENPANQYHDTAGDSLRERVAREALYSPEQLDEIARRKHREAEEVLLLGMRLKEREKAQGEIHRSLGGLMEAYSWFDVNLGLKIRTYSNSAPKAMALLTPTTPMKSRLDFLRLLVAQAPRVPEITKSQRWMKWIEQVEKIRLIRNDYAHGRWINGNSANNFHFAKLSWPVNSEPPQTLIDVTPAEIDVLSSEIWKLTRSMYDVLAPYFNIM